MSVINVFKHSIRTQNLNDNPSLSKLVSKSKLVPKKTGQSSIRKMSININRSCRVSSSFQTSYRTKPAQNISSYTKTKKKGFNSNGSGNPGGFHGSDSNSSHRHSNKKSSNKSQDLNHYNRTQKKKKKKKILMRSVKKQ